MPEQIGEGFGKVEVGKGESGRIVVEWSRSCILLLQLQLLTQPRSKHTPLLLLDPVDHTQNQNDNYISIMQQTIYHK